MGFNNGFNKGFNNFAKKITQDEWLNLDFNNKCVGEKIGRLNVISQNFYVKNGVKLQIGIEINCIINMKSIPNLTENNEGFFCRSLYIKK